MKKGIAVVGYNCIDFKWLAHGEIKPGEITLADISWSIGGIGGNTGRILAQLGDEVVVVGRIPRHDRLAEGMMRAIEDSGAETYLIGDSQTKLSASIISEGIDRAIGHQSGSNDRSSPEDLTDLVMSRCSHAHIGYFGLSKPDFIEATLARAQEHGLTTSFDTHGKPRKEDRPAFERCASHTNLLIPSYGEIARLLGASQTDLDSKNMNPKTMCTYLSTLGPEIVGVKLGKLGAILMDNQGNWVYSSVHKGIPRVTTGAGDAFYGGAASAYNAQNVNGVRRNLRAILETATCYGSVQVLDLPKNRESLDRINQTQKMPNQDKWAFSF